MHLSVTLFILLIVLFCAFLIICHGVTIRKWEFGYKQTRMSTCNGRVLYIPNKLRIEGPGHKAISTTERKV